MPCSEIRRKHVPRQIFLQRTAHSICRSHSTNVFLNHAQMDSESVQVYFEWACDLERPHGGFNFGDSCLILAESGHVGAINTCILPCSEIRRKHVPRQIFLQRTAHSICRSHSTNVFLNHAQMDSESVQVYFEWACDLERPHGGFNFGDSCLILAESGHVGAMFEIAFEVP